MKKITILISSLLIGSFIYAQQNPTGTSGNSKDWYRGGNNAAPPGLGGTNNIFGTMWNSPIYTYTNSQRRMKLNGSFTAATQYPIEGYAFAQGVNTSGYLLLGQDGATQNGNPSLFNSKGAFSMLHLNGIQNSNGGGFVQEFGYRPWMQTGVTFTGNNDLMYFGIRRLAAGQDLSELGVTWSDNSGNGFPGPDDFVFRFTSGGGGNMAISNNLSAENDLDGRHIARFAGTGELGLGNTFGTGNPMYVRPQSLMHMSLDLTKEVWMQITNQLGTDQTVDDGLRMGIAAGNNPAAFLRWQERTPFIIQTDWNATAGGINNGERMRISSINAPGIPNPAGLPNNTTRVAISHMGNNPISVPRSLLHLGYNTGNGAPGTFITDGWRDWMDIGTFTNNGTDNMYVGLKNEGTDRFDAVINWGDNQVAGSTPNGPDNLRFIFTSTNTALPPGQGDPVSQSNDGLETARFEPTAASTIPTNYGMMGIGNFSPTGPNTAAQDVVDAKLDIDGDLRIRTVTQDTTLLQVLVIDSTDHNRVHWRSISDLGGNVTADNGLSIDPANNVQLGHLPGNTGGELIRNTEIPTNGYNISFPGGGTSGVDQFIVGNPLISTVAKFQAWTNVEEYAVIGINSVAGATQSVGVRGQSLGGSVNNIGVQGISTSQSNQNVGIRGFASNGNNYNLAGDFDIPATTTLNNWGVHSEVVGSSSGRNVGGELNAIGVNNQQNYGVICRASSGNINYGIYSIASGGTTNWAGYFNGNVYISGTFGPSDANLKTNVLEITNAIGVINQLNPVSFDFNNSVKPRLNLQQGKQYGLIAQEVETILPELVSTSVLPAEYDSLGNEIDASFEFKTLDYEKFVPILIAGMKEQQQTISDLQSTVENLKNCLNNANICQEENKINNQNQSTETNYKSVELTNNSSIILDQNLPNPFAENTVIIYNIPTDVFEAKLLFYDLNGRIIKELVIEERGESKLTVYGENLQSGVYTYSLIADGELIATKKMVKK